MLGNSEECPPVPHRSASHLHPVNPVLFLQRVAGTGQGMGGGCTLWIQCSLCPGTAFSVLMAGQKGKYSPESEDCNPYNQGPMWNLQHWNQNQTTSWSLSKKTTSCKLPEGSADLSYKPTEKDRSSSCPRQACTAHSQHPPAADGLQCLAEGVLSSWCKPSCVGSCRVRAAATNPLALQPCRAAPRLPSCLGKAVQEDVPKHGSLSSEGKGYKQSSSWQKWCYNSRHEHQVEWKMGWRQSSPAVAKPQLVSHESSLQSWRWQQWAGHCAGLHGWMSSTEGLIKAALGPPLGLWAMSPNLCASWPIPCTVSNPGPPLAHSLGVTR